jgi:hypothetical protein
MRSTNTLIALLVLTGGAGAVCGDCTGDGTVSVLDALAAAQHAAGVITLPGAQLLDCDVDSDGSVQVLDALRVAQSAAGIPVTLTCAVLNQPPEVQVQQLLPEDEVLVPIYYQLSDVEGDVANVYLEHSLDGITWFPMTPAVGLSLPSLTTSLATSPGGVDLVFVWDSWQDLPTTAGTVHVRLRAEDAAVGPEVTTTIDLQNGAVASSWFPECLPDRYRFPLGSDVDFYPVVRNLLPSQQVLDFGTGCQVHYQLDGGAFDIGPLTMCLMVLTSVTLPADGVHEWPMRSHGNSLYAVGAGPHDVRIYVIPFTGTLYSRFIGVEVY